MDAAVSASDVKVRLGGRNVLDGVSFTVPEGSVTAVIGPSGSGKSVTLRAILGLLPHSGDIRVLDTSVGPASMQDVRRRTGVLFQQGALFSSLSVLQNVELPMRQHLRADPDLVRRAARAKLDMAGFPVRAHDLRPSELSGGMVKRAALARAIALDPELLFLDEPTAGLDPIGADEFDRLVLDMKEWLGLTVYMVTHDLDTIAATADRIVALSQGKILTEGAVEEVSRFDHPWIANYFGGPRARRLMEQTWNRMPTTRS